MINEKYDILIDKENTIEFRGRRLHRIKALKDIPKYNVSKNDLGGFVQDSNNLSQNGDCWIDENAKVFDEAIVEDDSIVRDNALVYERASISGNSAISDNAEVHESASIRGESLVFNFAEVKGTAIVTNSTVCEYSKVYDSARVKDNSIIHSYAKIYGNAVITRSNIEGNAKVYRLASVIDSVIKGAVKISSEAEIRAARLDGDMEIDRNIIAKISMSFKDIFQMQCKTRKFLALLSENGTIYYSLGCQQNITEEALLNRIHNTEGGLEENPHREEYLRAIKAAKLYLLGGKE